jgi:hypothetical protein
MNIGRKPPVGRITIYDSTLNDKVSESIGIYAIYDTIANHLENRDNDLDRWLTQLDIQGGSDKSGPISMLHRCVKKNLFQ